MNDAQTNETDQLLGPDQPISFLGLIIGAVALVLLSSSCDDSKIKGEFDFFSLVDISDGSPYGRTGRPLAYLVPNAGPQSPTIGTSYVQGSLATAWGPAREGGVLPRAAATNHLFTIGFGGGSVTLKEEDQRESSQTVRKQGAPGSDVYFVGVPENSITVLDSESGDPVATIPVGEDPRWIQLSPEQFTAWVTNFGSDSISMIDTDTRSVLRTINLAPGSGPLGIAPGPWNEWLYVVNSTSDSLSRIWIPNESVMMTVDAGAGATHVAVSPDGELAYVTNQTDGTVSVIDTLSMELVTTIEGIPGAASVTFGDRGSKAYVTGCTDSGELYFIQTSDHTVTGSIPVGSDPVSVRLSPYGVSLFVANRGSGTVTIVDVRTETVRETVQVGNEPVDVAAVL